MTTIESTDFKLRDYQLAGIEFLKTNKRVMLADEPGLGKTAQATFAAETPCIVVCPAYLVTQWEEWLQSLGYSVSAAKGTRDQRIEALNTETDWLVVNIEMLDGYDAFKDKQFSKRFMRWYKTMIIDEAHHLKGHNGKRAKIAVDIAKHVDRVYLLTATPIKREIDDLFMQFKILQPDIFTSYWRFVNQFCIVENNYFGTQVLGAKKSMLPELHKIIDMLMLKRTYADAKRELPQAIPKHILIDLNPQVRKIYDEAIDQWRIRDESGNLAFTNYMEAMHMLRQHLTGSLKVNSVKDIIEDENNQKTVIFSWYKNTAEAIANSLTDCALITGDVPATDRRHIAQNSHHVSATISAASEGIDLSTSRIVIFAEEDWTPGANYQALRRVLRDRNQDESKEPIIVYYVHCKRTIDEVIHKRQSDRSTTIKEVIKEALYL